MRGGGVVTGDVIALAGRRGGGLGVGQAFVGARDGLPADVVSPGVVLSSTGSLYLWSLMAVLLPRGRSLVDLQAAAQ